MKDKFNIKKVSLESLEKDGEEISQYLDSSELGKKYIELSHIDFLTFNLEEHRKEIIADIKFLEKNKIFQYEDFVETIIEEELLSDNFLEEDILGFEFEEKAVLEKEEYLSKSQIKELKRIFKKVKRGNYIRKGEIEYLENLHNRFAFDIDISMIDFMRKFKTIEKYLIELNDKIIF